jgi:lipopolysaccharide transport system ATP-binding protein
MNKSIIEVRDLSKVYRLGSLGATSFAEELRSLWGRFAKKEAQQENNEINHNSKFWALKDINFDVKKGEVIGIIGHNGAGKSTLLKILSRITEPTTGKIRLRGRVASLLEIGTGFHPDLTGRENTYLNGAIHGMNRKEIDEKFEQIIEFARIKKFIDTPVKRYSNGMFVRLAFAVAAHLEPEILIVDEVLAVGDAEFQTRCLNKMREVSNSGRTILFVSHNLQSIRSLCPKSILISKGKIEFIGKTDEALNRYLSENSMNISEGTVAFNKEADRNGTGEVLIKQISIRNQLGGITSSLSFRESFSIEIECDVEQPISQCTLVLSITDTNDIFAGITYSCDKYPEIHIQGGTIRFSFHNSTTLIPGEYYILPRITNKQGIVDEIQRAFKFTVVNAAIKGGAPLPQLELRGHTIMDGSWDVELTT